MGIKENLSSWAIKVRKWEWITQALMRELRKEPDLKEEFDKSFAELSKKARKLLLELAQSVSDSTIFSNREKEQIDGYNMVKTVHIGEKLSLNKDSIKNIFSKFEWKENTLIGVKDSDSLFKDVIEILKKYEINLSNGINAIPKEQRVLLAREIENLPFVKNLFFSWKSTEELTEIIKNDFKYLENLGIDETTKGILRSNANLLLGKIKGKKKLSWEDILDMILPPIESNRF